MFVTLPSLDRAPRDVFDTSGVADAPADTVAGALLACAALRARLDAAEAAWVAEFDARRLAAAHGARDTADFLARHCHAAPGTARARVDTAVTVRTVAGAAEALGSGTISADHVGCLARAVEATDAAAVSASDLVERAATLRPERFARHVRSWVVAREVDGGASAAEAQHAQRSATITHDRATGDTLIHASFSGDGASIVTGVLHGLLEERWRAEHGPGAELPPGGWSSHSSPCSSTTRPCSASSTAVGCARC